MNIASAGQAAGSLKLCGLKLYLYLMANADGFCWTLNPQAYANWLGIEDYGKSGRSVRKAIDDGFADLRAQGFVEMSPDGSYIISETPCFKVEEKEQKVPKTEQIVPLRSVKGTESSEIGTNSSVLLKTIGF